MSQQSMKQLSARYFKMALELDCLEKVTYETKSPYIKIDRLQLKKGTLGSDDTKRLFEAAKKAVDTKFDDNVTQIEVIISLHILSGLKENELVGLLNIPASLDSKGKFIVDTDKHRPWIPRDFLETTNSQASDIIVGTLSEFWKSFKIKTDMLSQVQLEGFGAYLDYAESIFSQVEKSSNYGTVAQQAEETSLKYLDDICCIKAGENINSAQIICNLYEDIIAADCTLPLFERIISLNTPKETDKNIDSGSEFLKNALPASGTMNSGYPLADSQRLAVHAFCQSSEGNVTAVSGPPGTGKTTMLQAIVAGEIVNRALAEQPAPVIVGTSVNNQAVTNIADSFSGVVPKTHYALDFRWLLKASQDDDGKITISKYINENQETLSGIALYCPSKAKLNEAQKKYMVEQTNRSKAYTMYSSPDYIACANNAFYEYAQDFFGTELSSLSDISSKLHKELKNADELRRKLLNTAMDYISAGTPLSMCAQYEKELAQIDNLTEQYKQRLKLWSELDAAYPKKGFLKKQRKPSDAVLISLNQSNEDTFPAETNTIDAVLEYYTSILKQVKKQKNELSFKAKKAQQSIQPFLYAFSQLLSYQEKKLWNQNSGYKLESDLIGADGKSIMISPNELPNRISEISPEKLLQEIDKYLDITLRYKEFWLAVHYYECRWLLFAERGELMSADECWRNTEPYQEKYWSQGMALTPCMVMTEYQLPKYFNIYEGKDVAGKSKTKRDFGRIDLLITDEAGQVNTPVALAGFSLAKKAVVVGDTHQLAPIWGLDEDTDLSVALNCGISKENWEKRKEKGLTCSAPSSVMRAAENACRWKYSEEEAGLFLNEHYRCVDGIISFCNSLIYNGRLTPCRGLKSNLSQVLTERNVSPFLFYPVSGSQDRRAGSSRLNEQEADAIVKWIMLNRTELERLYYDTENNRAKNIVDILGVVAPFSAQANCIRGKLAKESAELKSLTVGTAHRLQGAERPVILFSSTYGENSSDASFVNNMPELMNVAVSRAKDFLIVFGADARRKDAGKVFKIINGMARECEFNLTEEPQQTAKFTGTPQSLSMWRNSEMWQKSFAQKSPTVKEINQLLEKKGLLQKQDGTWVPTSMGLSLGIISVEGTDNNGKTYQGLQYYSEAAEYVLDYLKNAEL